MPFPNFIEEADASQGKKIFLYYASRERYGEEFYLNGRKEGRQVYYYEDGTLKTVEFYADGSLHGDVELYWPNGQLKRKCSFIQGKRSGYDRMWSERGALLDEGQYFKGDPVGEHLQWNERGRLIEKILFLDPKRYNYWRFDDEGNLLAEAIWIDANTRREKVWDSIEKAWKEKVAKQ